MMIEKKIGVNNFCVLVNKKLASLNLWNDWNSITYTRAHALGATPASFLNCSKTSAQVFEKFQHVHMGVNVCIKVLASFSTLVRAAYDRTLT